MLSKNVEELAYRGVLLGELEIDSEGRVWRVAARRGDRWSSGTRVIPCQRRRAEHATGGGYLQVRVMIDGKRANAMAHRLVWFHLKGSIPSGMTVNHKDGNRSHNHPGNLELATASEQVIHSRRVLGNGDQRGEKNPAVKLSTADVEEIRRRRAAGESLKAIAADYRVAMQTVSKIALNQRRLAG